MCRIGDPCVASLPMAPWLTRGFPVRPFSQLFLAFVRKSYSSGEAHTVGRLGRRVCKAANADRRREPPGPMVRHRTDDARCDA